MNSTVLFIFIKKIQMKNVFTSLLLFFAVSMIAQVPKNVVVEHFTNTLCSVCASRNPGFFTNLNNHPNVIHLAIHPSSPYSNCIFSQHNPTENDARTNYYNIYGSTPRLIVQGTLVPVSTNYGNASIFTSQGGQMSPFTVRIKVDNVNLAGQVMVEVVVKTEATHNYTDLNLFAAIAEDTIFYNAPNGENIHYNVFRKSVFETDGKMIQPAMMVGDSVVFMQSVNYTSVWSMSNLVGISILQEIGNKAVVQAATSKNQVFTATENIEIAPFKIYTAQNHLYFQADNSANYNLQVFDLQGKILRQFKSNGNGEWIFEDLITGSYLIRVQNEEKVWAKLLPIVN
jgi:hypothetical protein